MTTLLTAVIFIGAIISSVIPSANALGGSATTVSVTYGGATPTVCGIVAGQPSQPIQCWRNGAVFPVFSNISFESISGGRDVFCGIRSGGSALVCWNSTLIPKRLYFNETVILQHLTIGDVQICAITNSSKSSNRNYNCWRDADASASQNVRVPVNFVGVRV
ncbi:hypothetical protein SSX86_017237 [Deinandra increscens subsp. villosa]|uniref:non-specific serine/threonine protein kinase n=1 Tax=Deinandra increscens subsp. villosa TaxID=3103831 RepID=A0AAP0CZQ7_9ASTR